MYIKHKQCHKTRLGEVDPVNAVRQYQKALNDISTQHTVELYCVPGHAGVQGNESADKLTRGRFGSEVYQIWAIPGGL